jgi:hypothetical protein
MSETTTMLGGNRTGAKLAPVLTEEMIEGTLEFPPTSVGDAEALGDVRAEYTEAGEPLGTMPAPATMTQAAKTAVKAVLGAGPMQLLDKLGERLAFERAGTRLWEAMVAKHDATGGFDGGPSRDELSHIRDEELRHFDMLRALIERMDADPTAITPSAEVQAIASTGLPAVLTDPRTDLVQCLEAVLVAELVDNDCWPALIELLSEGGYTDEAQEFLGAVESEREHLQCVRMWLAAAQGRSVDAIRELSDAETETVLAMPAIAALTAEDDEEGTGTRTRVNPPRAARSTEASEKPSRAHAKPTTRKSGGSTGGKVRAKTGGGKRKRSR